MNQLHSSGETKEGDEAKPAAAMEEDDEAAAMQLALQMSMAPEQPKEEEAKSGEQQFQDPQFVNQLLGSLPGVNPNDTAIQSALQNLNQGDKKDDNDKKEEGDKKE